MILPESRYRFLKVPLTFKILSLKETVMVSVRNIHRSTVCSLQALSSISESVESSENFKTAPWPSGLDPLRQHHPFICLNLCQHTSDFTLCTGFFPHLKRVIKVLWVWKPLLVVTRAVAVRAGKLFLISLVSCVSVPLHIHFFKLSSQCFGGQRLDRCFLLTLCSVASSLGVEKTSILMKGFDAVNAPLPCSCLIFSCTSVEWPWVCTGTSQAHRAELRFGLLAGFPQYCFHCTVLKITVLINAKSSVHSTTA